MKRQHKRSLLFYRYLLSYFLIFLLPFTIISLGFYFISTNNVREAITSSNVEKLEQVRDFLDERLSELRNIAVRISLDSRLTPYKLSQAYSGREGYNELRNYRSSSSLVDTLVLMFYDTPTLHSSRGTTGIDNLVQNIYPLAEDEIEQFIEDVQSLTAPTLKTIRLRGGGDKPRSVLVYICPIPPQSTYHNGAVIFFIQEQKLSDLIATSLGAFDGITYIHHRDFDTVLTATAPVPDELLELSSGGLSTESTIWRRDFAGEDYTFVSALSVDNDLAFVSLMPTNQFYKKMIVLKRTIYLLLTLTATVGVVVTVIFTQRQYGPIEKLIESVNLKLDQNTIPRDGDLDSVRETIEEVFADTEELKRRIVMQRSYVLDQYLLSLLKGSGSKDPSLEELLPSLQLETRGEYFFVIKLDFPDRVSEKSLEQRERILIMLERVANRDCIAYGVELFNENAVALIVNIAEPTEKIRRDFAHGLVSGLVNQLKRAPVVGVGKIYRSPQQINHSFVEASAAVEHHLLADGHLIFFEDITESVYVGDWYSFEHGLQLSQAIKEGNREVAAESLSTIISELRDKKTSMQILKFMYYDLINIILKVNAELGMLISPDEIGNLNDFNQTEELETKLQALIDQMCKRIERAKTKRDEQVNNDIIKFILTRYCDHDLSLSLLADKFGLSVSYLSRLVKEKTGETFTQYVWNLRIAEFKKQLLTTSDTIKDLVAQIGYVDVANFTRRFRETEGMTPGQYRRKYSNPKAT